MTRLRRLLFLTTLAVSMAAFALGSGLAPTEPLRGALAEEAAGTDSDPSQGLASCGHDGPAAAIRIAVGTRGCWGGSDSSVELERRADRWTLTTREWVRFGQHRVLASTLDDDEAEALLASLEDALEPPLWRFTSCHSSAGVFARVTTQCGAAHAEPLMLDTHECLNQLAGDDHGAPKSRAAQMWRWSRDLFAARSDAPVVEDSAEEQAKTNAKWSSVYQDGRRVRHDPAEDWETQGQAADD